MHNYRNDHHNNHKLKKHIKLEKEWADSVSYYLPIASDSSPWVFSRQSRHTDADQGWKIHVSATILTASATLNRVALMLLVNDVLFKAPKSLAELKKINCGLFYGYGQVGKFLTVYPSDADMAVRLAIDIYRLTEDLAAPSIPFDARYGGVVYYRYGAFSSKYHLDTESKKIPAIFNNDGVLVEDKRLPGCAIPHWINDPFQAHKPHSMEQSAQTGRLRSHIQAFEAISQRGKGGVYRALNFKARLATICILKEGRKHGESEWNGCDGFKRVMHEGKVLRDLARKGVSVPAVIETYRVLGSYFLVMEEIQGENLQVTLSRRNLSIADRIAYCLELVRLIEKIHMARWVWRDCKPMNLMRRNSGEFVALDFEGACRTESHREEPWGTPLYLPLEWNKVHDSYLQQDLYAMGATMLQILGGKVRSFNGPPQLPPIDTLRQKYPRVVQDIVRELMSDDFMLRPKARDCALALSAVINE